MCMQSFVPLRVKKALGIFRELIPITRTTTTRVAFWDPPSGSKNVEWRGNNYNNSYGVTYSICYLCGSVAESVISPLRSIVAISTSTSSGSGGRSPTACSTRWLTAAGRRWPSLTVAVNRRLTSFDALRNLSILGRHLQYSLALLLSRCFQTGITFAAQ